MVISGDGDFAPAIKAVQQMGVRVDVISFRGNTSSDLKDVADDYEMAPPTSRARREGRPAAAAGSRPRTICPMTVVPEKRDRTTVRAVVGGGTGRRDDYRGGRDRSIGRRVGPRGAHRARAA